MTRISNRLGLVAAAVVALACLAAPAEAQRKRRFGNSNYVSNGHFGAGLELGAPTGFNGKLFLTPSNALNFGVGWLYDNYYRDGSGFHLYVDHLWHPVTLTENPSFKMPLFVGVGGRVWSFEDRRPDRDRDDRFGSVGVRVPVGIAFDMNNIPLDFYFHLTFVVDLFWGDYYDRLGPGVEGNVGVRFWFD